MNAFEVSMRVIAMCVCTCMQITPHPGLTFWAEMSRLPRHLFASASGGRVIQSFNQRGPFTLIEMGSVPLPTYILFSFSLST